MGARHNQLIGQNARPPVASQLRHRGITIGIAVPHAPSTAVIPVMASPTLHESLPAPWCMGGLGELAVVAYKGFNPLALNGLAAKK